MSTQLKSVANACLLDVVKRTPEPHLKAEWAEKFREFDGDDMQLVTLFRQAHNTPGACSALIKSLIDPEYTYAHAASSGIHTRNGPSAPKPKS